MSQTIQPKTILESAEQMQLALSNEIVSLKLTERYLQRLALTTKSIQSELGQVQATIKNKVKFVEFLAEVVEEEISKDKKEEDKK